MKNKNKKFLTNKLSSQKRESLAKDDAAMIIILRSIKQTKETFKQREEEYLKKTLEYKRLKRYFIIKEIKNKTQIIKRAIIWAIKLLIPDFLVGYPSFNDNLEFFLAEKKFLLFRLFLLIWLMLFIYSVIVMKFFYTLIIIGVILLIIVLFLIWKHQTLEAIKQMGIEKTSGAS